MSNDNITVYVLTIDHKHGTNTYAHRTAEGAHQSLMDYIAEWWGDCGFDGPVPEDDAEAIALYFDATAETYWLDSTILAD